MVLGRRDRVVQEMGQRLRVHGPVVKDGQTVLAFDRVFRGQRDGNEVGRDIAVKGNGGSDHCAHGREPGAFQEPAPVRIAFTAEQQPVGLVRITPIELKQSAFRCFLKHWYPPLVSAVRHSADDLLITNA